MSNNQRKKLAAEEHNRKLLERKNRPVVHAIKNPKRAATILALMVGLGGMR
jgi:hypothetical protein